jgi:glyoxylase-like metal-dependent hydrolase (beta-lactamase superfamily II)/rhodanese-related sulfurtransferase
LIVSDDLDRSAGVAFDGLVQLKKNSMCSWVLLDSASRTCVVIDPFAELADRIESLIRCQNSRVLAILDTHQHVDHQSCRTMLLQVLGSHATRLAQTDDVLGWPVVAQAPEGSDCGVCFLGDGSQAEYLAISSSLVIARSRLPGHTVDGVVYLVGKLSNGNDLLPADVQLAFSGDTLQIGGIGRSDFRSSSAAEMLTSLRRLPQIIGASTLICPTHDYTNGFSTTLAAELSENEFLRRAIDPVVSMTTEQFVAEKAAIDSRIDDAKNCELVCGLVQINVRDKASLDIRPDEIRDFFAAHPNWLVVDVREPHEFCFAQHWEDLGLRQPPENVPLTRLSHFLNGLLNGDHAGHAQREIVFVCRSGNRSSKAAEVASRLGIAGAWHIAGGIALGLKRHVESFEAAEEDAEYVI